MAEASDTPQREPDNPIWVNLRANGCQQVRGRNDERAWGQGLRADALRRDATSCPFGSAYLSLLRPGTRLLPHCGPTNARLRAHVTVAAAAGASLRVGAPDAKRVEWGAAPLVFDDSFEHDVIHEGADPRIVLVLDAWHPELPPERRRFELYGRLS